MSQPADHSSEPGSRIPLGLTLAVVAAVAVVAGAVAVVVLRGDRTERDLDLPAEGVSAAAGSAADITAPASASSPDPAATPPSPPAAPPAAAPSSRATPAIAEEFRFPVVDYPDHPDPVPAAVVLPGGRTWVPWPRLAGPTLPFASDTHPTETEHLLQGEQYFRAVQELWEAHMPPYTDAARARLEAGEPLARERANGYGFESVVDATGRDVRIRVDDDGRNPREQISLCPPHPATDAARDIAVYERPDVDPGLAKRLEESVSLALEPDHWAFDWFAAGMRTPAGRRVVLRNHPTSHQVFLLSYSPGEPMDNARRQEALTDLGYFPGDWSEPMLRSLTIQAATAAVVDTNVWHAVQSTGPQSLWEACQDLATLTPYEENDSSRREQLEALWARGIRLEHTSGPAERAFVVEISVPYRAGAVVCHPADDVHLVDASTGERLELYEHRPARVQAIWLGRRDERYFRIDSPTWHGACGDTSPAGAFARAMSWLHIEPPSLRDRQASFSQEQWASGRRSVTVPVYEWVAVSDEQAWEAHRDPAWNLRLRCESGIPVGVVTDGRLARQSDLGCTDEQWRAMEEAALAAPARTPQLSGRIWQTAVNGYNFGKSRLRSFDGMIGCAADAADISASLAAESVPGSNSALLTTHSKRPWPPGLLPVEPAGPTLGDDARVPSVYPMPHPPCPDAATVPADGRFWRPSPDDVLAGRALAPPNLGLDDSGRAAPNSSAGTAGTAGTT
ncbi:MAG TPA: hypothetical protein DEP66_01460 [Acidimicrobiaceae bacterium]|nr:hypothetical protein [Acidimicrobiaceae bacterium]